MALPDFSSEQWDFLAVLNALGGEAPVEVLGALVPLTPGPLFDLLKQGKAAGFLEQGADDLFRLTDDLSPEIARRLMRIGRPDRIVTLMGRAEAEGLLDRLAPNAAAGLFVATGRYGKAAALCLESAERALREGRLEEGCEFLERVIEHGERMEGDRAANALVVSASLKLTRLYFRLNRRFERIPALLELARQAAERVGDRRSRVLIGLQNAALYYMSDRLPEALEILALHLDEVRELGDEDIMARSAEFFALYYHLQGLFPRAAEYFERAVQSTDRMGEAFLNWPLPAYYGYCLAALGRFHRALGLLDANRRRAELLSEPAAALHFQALLGVVLMMMGRWREGRRNLEEVRGAGRRQDRPISLALCEFGLAYGDMMEGRIQEAYELVAAGLRRLSEAGIRLRRFPAPFVLEVLFEFKRSGLPDPPGLDFSEVTDQVLSGPNLHLKGVALRLLAREDMESKAPEAGGAVADRLKESERLLVLSGDPVELAGTRVVMARLALRRGDRRQAESLALKAWEGLSGLREDLFPDDLRFLVGRPPVSMSEEYSAADAVARIFEMMNRLLPSPDLDELLGRMVEVLGGFFNAERSGLFWFDGRGREGPRLRAARNLSREEAFSKNFRRSLTLVFQAFRKNEPLVVRPERRGTDEAAPPALSVVCLPFEYDGRLSGVLYHDNSHLDGCFDFLDPSLLKALTGHIGAYVERAREFGRMRHELDRLVYERRLLGEPRPGGEIITDSPVMRRLLDQADRAALADSTVLITGETGVGKELIARRIHALSPRRNGPFIVVDLAGTPESLVESELFGHEKGAFTGADRMRPGRMELAHQGTLFIDELGEVPLSMQVKLLRVLQEKSFYRIGGNRMLSSDFRLLAATNRNLETEVAAGRFRRDLYYRLNVVPLDIPPLRSRVGDPVVLAETFFQYYNAKYNRRLSLSPEDADRFSAYHWPGNVRELKNVIERAVLLSREGEMHLDFNAGGVKESHVLAADWPGLDELQRRYIEQVLERTGGRIAGPGGAAELLGMKRTSLYARMKKLGLR